MTYLALVLLALVVGVVQELRVRKQAERTTAAERAAADAEKVRAAWEEAAKASADEATRQENIITGHRAELAQLEESLRACNAPEAIRARLRELLRRPADPDPAA